MSDRPPCVRTSRPYEIVSCTLALSLALAAWGCSPGPAAPGQVGAATTSKVPEIAKRRSHMDHLLKTGESKAKSPARPQ